jgi:DNA-binding response OmpR family regulator
MQCNFNGKRVLVVEDDYLMATHLAEVLNQANAVVAGPFSTAAEAEVDVIISDLAVLDINLRGLMAFDLADRLTRHGIPYVFFTGYDKVLLPERFSGIDVINKPVDPLVAVRQLEIRSRETDSSSIVELIPLLRRRAREYLSDIAAADRLVEATLMRAVDEVAPTPAEGRLAAWLLELMAQTVQTAPGRFLN